MHLKAEDFELKTGIVCGLAPQCLNRSVTL